MILHYTDAGRASSGFAAVERLDCSVRAVAIALRLSYAQAHGKLKALGRRTGCKLYKSPAVFLDGLGLVQRPDLSCRTVATAVRYMTEGRFIVRVPQHVFAVIDGIIFDTREDAPLPGRRVRMVYEVPK